MWDAMERRLEEIFETEVTYWELDAEEGSLHLYGVPNNEITHDQQWSLFDLGFWRIILLGDLSKEAVLTEYERPLRPALALVEVES